MVNVDSLHLSLNELFKYNSKCVRDAIETLIKIHRNILCDQNIIKYRRLKPQNPIFYEKIWSIGPARQFMMQCGWLEVRDVLVFNNDEYLEEILQILLEHRSIVPADHEWKQENKFENLNESKLREEELRKKAVKEREKELEEFRKDKMYREQLAKTVKAQIEADRNKRRIIYTKPVVANKLNKGAKVMNLNSFSYTDSHSGKKLGSDAN